VVGPKAILIRLTAVALGLVVGGLVGEISVRVYASFDQHAHRVLLQADPLAVLIAAHGELGYRPRPNSVFRYGNGTFATTNSMGYRGPVVRTPKPSGTFRIILLGESTTHGWGVKDDETIDTYLRSLLRERHPDRSVDVINLAFDGYDSLQLLERLRSDGMRLEPDLIIVNSGINDVRNTRFKDLADPDPRTLMAEGLVQRLREEQARGGPTVWTRIKHYSYLARLPSVARQYLTASSLTSHKQVKVTPNLEAADIFERNLKRIVALASQANIPLLFSTPPSSLSFRYKPDATSTISYWIVDAATTQHLRDELARRMRRVVADERNERHQVAYIPHRLSTEMFLDDAHLTSSGNRQMALDFVDAVASCMDAGLRPACLKVERGVRR
jgi:lysophospholipase L1-like esterase